MCAALYWEWEILMLNSQVCRCCFYWLLLHFMTHWVSDAFFKYYEGQHSLRGLSLTLPITEHVYCCHFILLCLPGVLTKQPC